MRGAVLVTLANEKFVAQAKQLFSSVYFNSGWKGDYLLLAHEIPESELGWFRKKNILIMPCKPVFKKIRKRPNVLLSKFYLFSKQFKRWGNVVFLDSDIIVRGSLEKLAKAKGLAAVPDIFNKPLAGEFTEPKTKEEKELLKKTAKKYDFKTVSFNTGVLAFSTGIIKNNTFAGIKKMFAKYWKIHQNADQTALNLFFYKKWKKLPCKYNAYTVVLESGLDLPEHSAVLHMFSACGNEPWTSGNYFHGEWKKNLKKAGKIDLEKRPRAKKPGKSQGLWAYKTQRRFRKLFAEIDAKITTKISLSLRELLKLRAR